MNIKFELIGGVSAAEAAEAVEVVRALSNGKLTNEVAAVLLEAFKTGDFSGGISSTPTSTPASSTLATSSLASTPASTPAATGTASNLGGGGAADQEMVKNVLGELKADPSQANSILGAAQRLSHQLVQLPFQGGGATGGSTGPALDLNAIKSAVDQVKAGTSTTIYGTDIATIINLLFINGATKKSADSIAIANELLNATAPASSSQTLEDLIKTPEDAGKWVRAGNDSHLEITRDDGTVMTLADYWANVAESKVDPVGPLGRCFNETTSATVKSDAACDDFLINGGTNANSLIGLSQAEVSDLSPAVVFGILKYLGFQMVNNNGLNEVQSWKSWWANTPSDIKTHLLADPNTATPLAIKSFLEKAIVFINSNPAILNKGANQTCEDKAGYGLRCVKGKHNPKSFDEFRNQIDLTLNRFRGVPLGMLGLGSVGFVPYGMTGGGAAVPIGLMPSARGSVDRLPDFTKQVRALYASFVSRLEAMKKTLSASTKASIETVFKQTQDKEDEAKRLLSYFEKYAQVTAMTGDRSATVYSEAELKKASDNFSKTLGKYRRRLYSLVDIVSVASQAVSDAELKTMSM